MPNPSKNLLPFCSQIGAVAISFCVVVGTNLRAEESWTQWRGNAQNGVANGDSFPHQWSEESGVGWKTDIPGLGGSTPIVSGGTAFLTSGVEGKNTLFAVDTKTGSLKWKTTIGNDAGAKHKKGGGSNPSAITDGQHVFAFFRSGNLGCVDMSGKVLWEKSVTYDLKDGLWWDLGTSPILTDMAVVVTLMHTGPSYLVAFDKKSGEQLWKASRDVGAPKEAAQSYATPLNVKVKGEDAIAVMGADHLTLHSATNGEELGRLGGFNPTAHQYFRSISSPVADGDIVVCPYARGDTITAVDMNELASGKGKDAIVWFRDELGSDVPTPAIHNGRVYVVGDGKKVRGRITCVDLKTGATIWEVQLPKSRIGFSSSPLVAGDHLYVTQENATTHVIGPLSSESPQVIATNKLDDDEQFTVASPVPLGKSLLIRSKHRLYQVAGN